jgi:hypothetical protein
MHGQAGGGLELSRVNYQCLDAKPRCLEAEENSFGTQAVSLAVEAVVVRKQSLFGRQNPLALRHLVL